MLELTTHKKPYTTYTKTFIDDNKPITDHKKLFVDTINPFKSHKKTLLNCSYLPTGLIRFKL